MLVAGAGQEPAARDAEHLAALMAHSARLVRGIVQERLAELRAAALQGDALLQVRQEFRDVLYAHPEAGGYSSADFDALFSAAFAQTLAFGLLLVREATDRPVDRDAWEHMPAEHPLMRTALRVLSQPEIVRDDRHRLRRDARYRQQLRAAKSRGPARRARSDPLLLRGLPSRRSTRRSARITASTTRRSRSCATWSARSTAPCATTSARAGLRDPDVTILDPATGTGTFLLGIAERVREQEAGRATGMAALALRDLAGRMFGFELLVGPYAVAHYRLHHALRGGPGGALELPRLGVYLADTLSRAGAADADRALGFVAAGHCQRAARGEPHQGRAADPSDHRQPALQAAGGRREPDAGRRLDGRGRAGTI